MRLTDNTQRYGLISILFHWVMAVLIIGLFLLGDFMVGLDYYHPWYLQAPDLHRSLGIVTAVLLLCRWLWRRFNPLPRILGSAWEQTLARQVHGFFYILITGVVISGYLISTADGQGIEVFSWFELPALFTGPDNQEDIAGLVHEWLAWILMALILLHSAAALKHHFIDADRTLLSMLQPGGDTLNKED